MRHVQKFCRAVIRRHRWILVRHYLGSEWIRANAVAHTTALLAANDNWQDTQPTEIQSTGLAPTDVRESAILTSLTPGNYTAIVRGKNETIGVALVEVYNVQ